MGTLTSGDLVPIAAVYGLPGPDNYSNGYVHKEHPDIDIFQWYEIEQ